MQTRFVQFGPMSVAIRRLRKYLSVNKGPNSTAATQKLVFQAECALKEAADGFKLTEAHVSSLLYKHTSINALRTFDLLAVEKKFRDLGAKLEFSGTDVVGELECFPLFHNRHLIS